VHHLSSLARAALLLVANDLHGNLHPRAGGIRKNARNTDLGPLAPLRQALLGALPV
jgi:hypothetical protein